MLRDAGDNINDPVIALSARGQVPLFSPHPDAPAMVASQYLHEEREDVDVWIVTVIYEPFVAVGNDLSQAGWKLVGRAATETFDATVDIEGKPLEVPLYRVAREGETNEFTACARGGFRNNLARLKKVPGPCLQVVPKPIQARRPIMGLTVSRTIPVLSSVHLDLLDNASNQVNTLSFLGAPRGRIRLENSTFQEVPTTDGLAWEIRLDFVRSREPFTPVKVFHVFESGGGESVVKAAPGGAEQFEMFNMNEETNFTSLLSFLSLSRGGK